LSAALRSTPDTRDRWERPVAAIVLVAGCVAGRVVGHPGGRVARWLTGGGLRRCLVVSGDGNSHRRRRQWCMTRWSTSLAGRKVRSARTTTDVPPLRWLPGIGDDGFATIINMNRLGELTAELGFIPADAAAIGGSPYGRRLVLSRIPACRLGIRVQRDDPEAEELALI
jgi:hypothetical protein